MEYLHRWESRYNPDSDTSEHMRALLATATPADLVAYLSEVQRRLSETEDTGLARMVLNVHAPLANRLNMQALKHQLEDEAFRIRHPEQYEMTVKLLRRNKAARQKEALHLKRRFARLFEEAGIEAEDISGRNKQPYSLYKKLSKKGTISDIHDLLALRIIVSSETECYRVLDALHTEFIPDLDRFKDYIKQPKPNGYRSLHTSIVWDKKAVEVQIRTPDMDREAEAGTAAHWQYDQHKDSKHYLRGSAAAAVNESVKPALYVFSPAGDVYELPEHATPLDFAFAVHTGVGLRTRGVKINGAIAKLDSGLSHGDVVEVITGNEARPKKDWLYIVASSKARNRIQAWLKREERSQYRDVGKQKLLETFHGELPKALDAVCRHYKFTKLDDLYVAVGAGYIRPGAVQNIVYPPREQSADDATPEGRTSTKSGQTVRIAGMEGLQYHMASCCNPRPSDAIVGYITRSLGVTIHRSGCSRVNSEPERLIEARWTSKEQGQGVG